VARFARIFLNPAVTPLPLVPANENPVFQTFLSRVVFSQPDKQGKQQETLSLENPFNPRKI